jgi:hypothetical protein
MAIWKFFLSTFSGLITGEHNRLGDILLHQDSSHDAGNIQNCSQMTAVTTISSSVVPWTYAFAPLALQHGRVDELTELLAS